MFWVIDFNQFVAIHQKSDAKMKLVVRPVASGIEVKILFALLQSKKIAPKKSLWDNEKPARTPNVIKLRNQFWQLFEK